MNLTKDEAELIVESLNSRYARQIQDDPILRMLRDLSHNLSVHYNIGIFSLKKKDLDK